MIQSHGWRFPFLVCGIAGLALVLLLFLTVPEPRRVLARPRDQHPGFAETVSFLARSRAYMLTVAGALFIGVQLYAGQVWNPTFLVRVHHLNPTQVGTALSLFRGVAGLVGVYLGGYLAQLLG